MITLIKKSVFSFSQKQSFMITCKEASQLLNKNDVKFIDCRDPNLYAQDHIQGAFNVNEIFTFLSTSDQQGQKVFETIFEDAFQRMGLNNNDLALVYEDCLKSRFGSSCRGLFILKTLGHKNVQIIEGGFKEWKQNNYTSDNKYPQIQLKGNFKPQWNSQNYANKYDMLQAIQNNDTYIIDVRNDDEWLGESSSPYGSDFLPRKGRLPKSIHLNWIQLMKEIDGKTQMIQNQEIDNILSKHGIKKDSKIIVYCFKGARASNSLVAIQEAGYTNVKNYFSGFNEWARDFKYEIDNQFYQSYFPNSYQIFGKKSIGSSLFSMKLPFQSKCNDAILFDIIPYTIILYISLPSFVIFSGSFVVQCFNTFCISSEQFSQAFQQQFILQNNKIQFSVQIQ